MIVLNKIAVRYWKISEKQRSARPDERYRDVEIQVVDIMLELLNLLTLIGCNDIEGVIKHRIDQKEGKEMPNEKTEIDNPDT